LRDCYRCGQRRMAENQASTHRSTASLNVIEHGADHREIHLLRPTVSDAALAMLGAYQAMCEASDGSRASIEGDGLFWLLRRRPSLLPGTISRHPPLHPLIPAGEPFQAKPTELFEDGQVGRVKGATHLSPFALWIVASVFAPLHGRITSITDDGDPPPPNRHDGRNERCHPPCFVAPTRSWRHSLGAGSADLAGATPHILRMSTPLPVCCLSPEALNSSCRSQTCSVLPSKAFKAIHRAALSLGEALCSPVIVSTV
jgi:hypothetical protein